MATTKAATAKPKARAKQADVIGLPASMKAVLSIDQVAAGMDYSRRKVEKMIASGEFPDADCPLGSSPRWQVSTFNAWIEAKAEEAAKKPKAPKKAPAGKAD